MEPFAKAGAVMTIMERMLKKIEVLELQIASLRKQVEKGYPEPEPAGSLRGLFRDIDDIPFSEFMEAKKIWKVRDVE